jgi:DNA repair protein RadC
MVLINNSQTKLLDANDAVKVLRELLKTEDEIDQEKEHFYVIHLNTRSVIKTVELVSLGTLNSAVVHPREVFRRAVSEGACCILLAHNHPSTVMDPSDEDVTVTKAMFDAGRVLGIDVVDHIIFGFNSYFSFRDNAVHHS